MPNYLDQEGLGYYDGKMKVYMSNAISSAVAATYKPGGSRTFEQLPSLVAEYVGFIYNITNDFTTTSDFVEGAGTFCKAGANVGIVNIGTNQSPVYKYDLFSAFVDLSNYATLDDLPTKTSDLTNDSGYASAFTGTTAQWNALTDAQKAKYELVCLTDDLGDSDNVKDLMINKAQATVIARQDEAATASRSYVVGDFVYRDNVLYKVTAAISTGDSFVVGTNISTTTVETELSGKVDKVAGKGLSTNDYSDTEKGKVDDATSAIEATQDMISDAYISSRTYNVGNYCIYDNALYKCNTANTTGTWDSSKWDVVTIVNEFTIVKDELKTIDDYGYGDTIRFSNNDLVVYGFASQNSFIRFFVPVNIKKNIPQHHIHITNIPTSWAVHCANGTVFLTNISVTALYRSASGVTIYITFDANNSITDLPVVFLLTGFELSIYN